MKFLSIHPATPAAEGLTWGFPLAFDFSSAEPSPARERTEVAVRHGGSGLQLFFRCHDSLPGQARAVATRHGDPDLWKDDGIEIYVDPAGGGDGFRKFAFNIKGVRAECRQLADQSLDPAGPGEGWSVAVKSRDDGWEAEVNLPSEVLGARPHGGALWRFAICRFAHAGERRSATSSPRASHGSPGAFGYLYCADATHPLDAEHVAAALEGVRFDDGLLLPIGRRAVTTRDGRVETGDLPPILDGIANDLGGRLEACRQASEENDATRERWAALSAQAESLLPGRDSDLGAARVIHALGILPIPITDLEIDLTGVPQALRCTSGLILSDEGLRDGAWIGRYWSPIGRPETDPVCRGDAEANAAFHLSIDGAAVSNRWAVVKMVVGPSAGGERAEVNLRHAGQPVEGKVHTLAGPEHAEVVLRHAEKPLEVSVHTVVDGTGLFTRWLSLRNTGSAPWALSALEVWSGRVFPCQFGDRYWGEQSKYATAHGDYEIGCFVDSRHSNEGHFEWRPLGDEPFELSETSGKSGWGHPILYLRDGKAGNIFVMQLAWSGNWRLRASMVDGRVHAGIGPSGPGNMRVLAPGESIRTPEVHFGGMAGDLSEMAQALHAHQRRSVLPAWDADRCGLISYNHWSYMNHEMSEERLIREIDVAADLGAEVFTIDAGWYGNLGEDWHMTGNWRPGNRLPDGFAPVFAHARKRGLKCGLWLWIEAASENSPIIQQHPDWLIEVDGKRMNNHLDLAKPEVAAWVESEIERAISDYGIDLFRLDYNAYPGKGGTHLRDGIGEQTVWRHYEAMYGIWERVRQRHPALILENCAGGGGRTDLGMVSRTDFTWFSDYVLAPRAVRMQQGIMLALPPERLARFTGVVMNGHLGGDLDMQLRMNMLLGNPCISGVWPTLAEKNQAAFERIRHGVEFFKRHVRTLKDTCRVYQHTEPPSGEPVADWQPEGWSVFEYAAPDATKAIGALFRLAGQAAPEYRFAFRGLRRDRTYRVQLDNTGESFAASGRELVETGIPVRLSRPMTSELITAELAQ